MAKLQVKVRDIDDDILFTHKKTSLGSKSIETPAKALPIKKIRTGKDVASSEVRGHQQNIF